MTEFLLYFQSGLVVRVRDLNENHDRFPLRDFLTNSQAQQDF